MVPTASTTENVRHSNSTNPERTSDSAAMTNNVREVWGIFSPVGRLRHNNARDSCAHYPARVPDARQRSGTWVSPPGALPASYESTAAADALPKQYQHGYLNPGSTAGRPPRPAISPAQIPAEEIPDSIRIAN